MPGNKPLRPGFPNDVARAAGRLMDASRLRPRLAIVLGSGFHPAVASLKLDAKLSYAEIPGFPPVGVSGHAGELLFGYLGGTPVIILSGRTHYYEGLGMERVTFAVRVVAAYGVTDLLLTNAAGGLAPGLRPGDFMMLTDHINLMGVNPLRGSAEPGRSSFLDLTCAYDRGLRRVLGQAAQRSGVRLRKGVYLALSGPTYETPAEVRAFRKLGADAVGMSTVPEVLVARQCGLRVAALSCITNLAAGRSRRELSHAEVLETAKRVGRLGARLLERFARVYGQVT